MSEPGLSAPQEIAPDNVGDDVRAAIEELKVGAESPQANIVLSDGEQGRARDEAGRFAAKLKEDKRETLTLPEKKVEGVKADPAAALGVGAPNTATAPAAEPAVIEPPKPAVEPPKGWSAEAKAEWAKLPEAIQREAVRREEALTKQLFQHDESRDFGRKLQEAANPYIVTIRAEGADIPKAFTDYLQTATMLRQGSPYQKAQALMSVIQKYNVDLSLAHQQGAMHPEVADLRHQLSELQQRLQGQDQERQQREEQSLQQQIAEFSSLPGHEHFEKVKPRMGALLETGEAKDLEDAYQQAIWSHPEIRTSLQQAQTQATEAQRAADLKAKADAARAAAVSVKGAPGGSRPLNGAQSHGSIADDLRAAVAEVRGRV